MYCPNCAAPIDGMKFCRACGTNVSLVPQALTGQLPAAPPTNPQAVAPPTEEDNRHGRRRRRQRREPSLASGVQTLVMGFGFLFVSLGVMAFAPAGRLWWFWLLIPASSLIGSGIAEIIRAQQLEKQKQQQLFYAPPPQAFQPVAPTPSISAPTTSELRPPQRAPEPVQSITEHTTKHLDPSGSR